MLFPLTLASAFIAIGPAMLTVANLREYREPPLARDLPVSVTVIVPARNEEAGIAACLEGILASPNLDLEVLVVDDGSTDRTAAIVSEIAAYDGRVRLLRSAPLPPGWNGKQHACWQAAQAALSPVLCFLDADVRLRRDALPRMSTLLEAGDGRPASGMPNAQGIPRTALVSGFPQEETGSPLEWLLLPLIHFILLAMLPMRLLRQTASPAASAGCGQFLMVDRAAYFAVGGHAAIRETMHDGLRLPRLLRGQGYPTRLADLTHLASCRMYHTASATWNGLAKNATEGLASPGAIVPMTLLLGLGQVLPVPLLVAAVLRRNHGQLDHAAACIAVAALACLLSYLPRVLQVARFRQDWRSAALHPVGTATLLLLQWYAFGRKLLGRPATWKARNYSAN